MGAAFSFQFQQHPLFLFRGYQNKYISHVVMLWIGVEAEVLMYHKIQFQFEDGFNHKPHVCGGKAYPYIIKQHGKRCFRVVAFQSLQQVFFEFLARSSTAGLYLAKILPCNASRHRQLVL